MKDLDLPFSYAAASTLILYKAMLWEIVMFGMEADCCKSRHRVLGKIKQFCTQLAAAYCMWKVEISPRQFLCSNWIWKIHTVGVSWVICRLPYAYTVSDSSIKLVARGEMFSHWALYLRDCCICLVAINDLKERSQYKVIHIYLTAALAVQPRLTRLLQNEATVASSEGPFCELHSCMKIPFWKPEYRLQAKLKNWAAELHLLPINWLCCFIHQRGNIVLSTGRLVV